MAVALPDGSNAFWKLGLFTVPLDRSAASQQPIQSVSVTDTVIPSRNLRVIHKCEAQPIVVTTCRRNALHPLGIVYTPAPVYQALFVLL
jgi:hypothetical protein